jgi:hypothetical protein
VHRPCTMYVHRPCTMGTMAHKRPLLHFYRVLGHHYLRLMVRAPVCALLACQARECFAVRRRRRGVRERGKGACRARARFAVRSRMRGARERGRGRTWKGTDAGPGPCVAATCSVLLRAVTTPGVRKLSRASRTIATDAHVGDSGEGTPMA